MTVDTVTAVQQWFSSQQLTPGSVLFQWRRTFTLWGYTGSHSVVLFRSVKGGPDDDEEVLANRIDLVFKPVKALNIRTSYRTLRVEVATEERASRVLERFERTYGDERVLELIGPDGSRDHVVCMAVGWHEDSGEYWEPSPFAQDLSDGRTPPWRTRILGGGPDGELTARYASTEDLVTALDTRQRRHSGGLQGRYLFVTMMRIDGPDESTRPSPLSAFLTREEAEEHVRTCEDSTRQTDGFRYEYWVDVVPIDL